MASVPTINQPLSLIWALPEPILLLTARVLNYLKSFEVLAVPRSAASTSAAGKCLWLSLANDSLLFVQYWLPFPPRSRSFVSPIISVKSLSRLLPYHQTL